jgi:pantetheine-phosphate adenylyltransferase
MKIAIYPGSFNPFHEGHVSIVQKSLNMFDLVYIVVTQNPDKELLNNFELNHKNIQELFKENSKVIVLINKTKLTGTLANELGANFLIRSARTKIDFDYELNLANANNFVNNTLETVILFPTYDYKDISSTLIRHKKLMKTN